MSLERRHELQGIVFQRGYRHKAESTERVFEFVPGTRAQFAYGAMGALDEIRGPGVGIERRLIEDPGGTFEPFDQPGPVAQCGRLR